MRESFHNRIVDRRTFVGASASCLAHLSLMSAGFPPLRGRRVFDGPAVRQEPWGRLERVHEGIWALVSTPLADRTTLCNGGIVAGRNGVLMIESFASPAGAEWMARQARELAGSWPTHVVLSHYHGDHTSGLEGLAGDVPTPAIHATGTTRDLVAESVSARSPDSAAVRMLAELELVDPSRSTPIDLGGRTVTIVPRDGHTASDVTVELDDPSVVFCGDLVWNQMFPNYRDAVPSHLSRDVRALQRGRNTVYVPGHGPLAQPADLARYIRVIDEVEEAARSAVRRGDAPADAAARFQLSPELGEWMLFNPRYFEVAFTAWARELGAA